MQWWSKVFDHLGSLDMEGGWATHPYFGMIFYMGVQKFFKSVAGNPKFVLMSAQMFIGTYLKYEVTA